MKGNRTISLILVILLLLVASGLVVNHAKNTMNLGLDLRGGVYVLYQAVETEDDAQSGDKIDRAITIINNRINALGVVEPDIQREGVDRIRVELPGVEDQRKAREVMGTTAMLTFVGPDDEVIMTGGDLKSANVVFDSRTNKPVVSLEFSPEGTSKFAAATEKFIGQMIVINLDEQVVSSPVVKSIITDGRAQIEGSMGIEEAQNLALVLRSGALPVKLIELETRTLGPKLGQDSLDRSVRAGVAGLVLVLLFMFAYYRSFGLVSNVALVVYMALVLAMLTAINATMTLFGIAGLILSIGMAVDANVIIFERIKEELKNGRAMRTAIEAGFEQGFRAILDSNVTTLIAAAVLFNFTSGPVRGFAVTLSIGILASMLTAVVLTRYLLRQFNRAGLFKTPENAGIRG